MKPCFCEYTKPIEVKDLKESFITLLRDTEVGDSMVADKDLISLVVEIIRESSPGKRFYNEEQKILIQHFIQEVMNV